MQSVALPEVLEVALVARRGVVAISLAHQRLKEMDQLVRREVHREVHQAVHRRMQRPRRKSASPLHRQSQSPRRVRSVRKDVVKAEGKGEERAEVKAGASARS